MQAETFGCITGLQLGYTGNTSLNFDFVVFVGFFFFVCLFDFVLVLGGVVCLCLGFFVWVFCSFSFEV